MGTPGNCHPMRVLWRKKISICDALRYQGETTKEQAVRKISTLQTAQRITWVINKALGYIMNEEDKQIQK